MLQVNEQIIENTLGDNVQEIPLNNRKKWEKDEKGRFLPGHSGGPGRPRKTLEKKVIEKEFKQRILRSIETLANSKFNVAHGCQFLYKIETIKKKDKNGKITKERKRPVLVTEQWEIENYLAGDYKDDEDTIYHYITTEKPDSRALEDLFDRALGKVANKNELLGKDGESLEIDMTLKSSLDKIYGSKDKSPDS